MKLSSIPIVTSVILAITPACSKEPVTNAHIETRAKISAATDTYSPIQISVPLRQGVEELGRNDGELNERIELIRELLKNPAVAERLREVGHSKGANGEK